MGSRSHASVLVVLALSALLFGCIEPVKLAVTPVTPAVAPQVDRPCQGGDCLAARQPQARVTLGAGEEFLWARVSPDGRTLIAAIAPKASPNKRAPLPQISFAAFDVAEGKELWRARLAQKVRVDAEDAFFVGKDKVALVTEGGFLWNNTLMVLDRTTGRELWRTPRDTDKPLEAAHTVLYDPQQDVFIVGSTTLRLIDANTGEVLATRPTMHKVLNPRVTGGVPFASGGDLYLYEHGLVRVSRGERKFVWARKFVTFAEDDYRGANIGLAVASALLGAGPSNIPPDYLVGRTTEPVVAGDRVIVGALGRVYAINTASGDLVWAKDLAVPQIARVAVRGDRVYVLAGGSYIFWHGRQGMSVREPIRYGLYALNLSDGKPVAEFTSPFNANVVSGALTAADVEKFRGGDAFEEEEDWGNLNKTGATPAGAPAAGGAKSAAFSKTRLVDAELLDGGLLVLTDDAAVVLDDSGREVRRLDLADLGKGVALERVGGAIVLRTRSGAVAFDTAGTVMWQRKVEAPLSLEVVSSGYVPLVRTMPWRSFRNVEVKHFAGQLFWVQSDGQIVLPATESRLMGLRVQDGQTAWEFPIGSKIAVENGYVVSIQEGTAEIHKISS